LAQAILSSELTFKCAPDECVLVTHNPQGEILDVYLPEVRESMLIPGVEEMPVSKLPPALMDGWIRDQLGWLVQHPTGSPAPTLRILLMSRQEVARWIHNQGLVPPRFLEPEASNRLSQHPGGASTLARVTERSPSKTAVRNQRWIAK